MKKEPKDQKKKKKAAYEKAVLIKHKPLKDITMGGGSGDGLGCTKFFN